jgi:hypothetical protein
MQLATTPQSKMPCIQPQALFLSLPESVPALSASFLHLFCHLLKPAAFSFRSQGSADAAVELITGVKKQRTPASGKKDKAPLLGKPQHSPAVGASPKIGPKSSPIIEAKGRVSTAFVLFSGPVIVLTMSVMQHCR